IADANAARQRNASPTIAACPAGVAGTAEAASAANERAVVGDTAAIRQHDGRTAGAAIPALRNIVSEAASPAQPAKNGTVVPNTTAIRQQDAATASPT